MKPPSGSSKITKVWLEDIFSKYEDKKQKGAAVTVRDFTIKKGTEPGDGFNSELVILECQAIIRIPESSDGDTNVLYQVAVKFFSQDAFTREFNKRAKSNLKESLMYSEIINELNDFLSAAAPEEPKISIPDLIYGTHDEKDFVLVMENLKINGYKTNDKKKGLDRIHVMKAVDQAARLHAVSYAHNTSHDFLQKYPFFEFPIDMISFFESILEINLQNCLKYIKSLDDMEELAKRLENSIPSCLEKYMPIMKVPGKVSCLIHGDFWNNNLMFKQEEVTQSAKEQDAIQDIMIIDWANSCWGNPIFDLHYLIYTSTRRELRENHLEEILQHYHSTFTSVTNKLGIHVPNWTYEDFKKEWDRTFLYGFLLGSVLVHGTLSESNPANKPQGSSFLDHPLLFPVKVITDGMKTGMAKLISASGMKSVKAFLMKSGMKMMLKPICAEVLSGSNEVMNTRLLELICEADEKGLFSVEPVQK